MGVGRAGLLTAITIAAMTVSSPWAHAATCPAQTVHGVRVIELTGELGCDTGARLAAATVRADGYLQDDEYYCRWGQGGTRPVQRRGRTFVPGFCIRKATNVEASFLARPGLRSCRRSELEDLRVRYIDCATARRVYRRSLTVAARRPGASDVGFTYAGYAWRCHARNPHKRHGNPAWYEWLCRAPDDVLVHYRWFGGE